MKTATSSKKSSDHPSSIKRIKKVKKIIHKDGTESIIDTTDRKDERKDSNIQQNNASNDRGTHNTKIKSSSRKENNPTNTSSDSDDQKNNRNNSKQKVKSTRDENGGRNAQPNRISSQISDRDHKSIKNTSSRGDVSLKKGLQGKSSDSKYNEIANQGKNEKLYDGSIYNFASEFTSDGNQNDEHHPIDPRFIKIVTQRRNVNTNQIETIERYKYKEGVKVTPELRLIKKQLNNGAYFEMRKKNQRRSSASAAKNNSSRRLSQMIEQNEQEEENRNVINSEEEDIIIDQQDADSEDNNDIDNVNEKENTQKKKHHIKYTTVKRVRHNSESDQVEEYYSNETEFTSSDQRPKNIKKYKPLFVPKKRFQPEPPQPKTVHRKLGVIVDKYEGSLDIPNDAEFIKNYGSIRPEMKEEFTEEKILPKDFDKKGEDVFPEITLLPIGQHIVKVDDKYYLEKYDNGFITRYRSTEDGKRVILLTKGEDKKKKGSGSDTEETSTTDTKQSNIQIFVPKTSAGSASKSPLKPEKTSKASNSPRSENSSKSANEMKEDEKETDKISLKELLDIAKAEHDKYDNRSVEENNSSWNFESKETDEMQKGSRSQSQSGRNTKSQSESGRNDSQKKENTKKQEEERQNNQKDDDDDSGDDDSDKGDKKSSESDSEYDEYEEEEEEDDEEEEEEEYSEPATITTTKSESEEIEEEKPPEKTFSQTPDALKALIPSPMPQRSASNTMTYSGDEIPNNIKDFLQASSDAIERSSDSLHSLKKSKNQSSSDKEIPTPKKQESSESESSEDEHVKKIELQPVVSTRTRPKKKSSIPMPPPTITETTTGSPEKSVDSPKSPRDRSKYIKGSPLPPKQPEKQPPRKRVEIIEKNSEPSSSESEQEKPHHAEVGAFGISGRKRKPLPNPDRITLPAMVTYEEGEDSETRTKSSDDEVPPLKYKPSQPVEESKKDDEKQGINDFNSEEEEFVNNTHPSSSKPESKSDNIPEEHKSRDIEEISISDKNQENTTSDKNQENSSDENEKTSSENEEEEEANDSGNNADNEQEEEEEEDAETSSSNEYEEDESEEKSKDYLENINLVDITDSTSEHEEKLNVQLVNGSIEKQGQKPAEQPKIEDTIEDSSSENSDAKIHIFKVRGRRSPLQRHLENRDKKKIREEQKKKLEKEAMKRKKKEEESSSNDYQENEKRKTLDLEHVKIDEKESTSDTNDADESKRPRILATRKPREAIHVFIQEPEEKPSLTRTKKPRNIQSTSTASTTVTTSSIIREPTRPEPTPEERQQMLAIQQRIRESLLADAMAEKERLKRSQLADSPFGINNFDAKKKERREKEANKRVSFPTPEENKPAKPEQKTDKKRKDSRKPEPTKEVKKEEVKINKDDKKVDQNKEVKKEDDKKKEEVKVSVKTRPQRGQKSSETTPKVENKPESPKQQKEEVKPTTTEAKKKSSGHEHSSKAKNKGKDAIVHKDSSDDGAHADGLMIFKHRPLKKSEKLPKVPKSIKKSSSGELSSHDFPEPIKDQKQSNKHSKKKDNFSNVGFNNSISSDDSI